MQKKKVFLMFSDLDNTIIPTDDKTKRKFASLARKLRDNNNIELRFCPVSGRDQNVVSDVMKELSKPFEEAGLEDIIEIGAGEQGGLLVHKESQEMNRPILDYDEALKKDISDTVNRSYFAKWFKEEELQTINVFVIREDVVPHLSDAERREFFQTQLEGLENYLNSIVGDKVQCSKGLNDEIGVLEVVPNHIGKEIAVREIFEYYQKKYNIVGFCYCGDHENDLRAIDYVSRLAEVPGINTHVFIPVDAQNCTKEPLIKKWQDKMGDKSRGSVIRQGNYKTLRGILDVMNKEYKNGNLVGNGLERNNSMDDFGITLREKMLKAKSSRNTFEI